VNRNEIEQKLWADQYHWGMVLSEDKPISCEFADAAVEQFRQRYPVEPAAPEPTWYDEPPFAKDGTSHPCWIVELCDPILVAYFSDGSGWNWSYTGLSKREFWHPLKGHPVCPIVKPQEPPRERHL
jgi:hypothetical protein